MRNLLYVALVCAVLSLMAPALLADGVTAGGTLTVNATIDPSISLIFNSNTSGVVLTSTDGTNAAALAFGHVKAFGYTPATGVTQSVSAGTSFTVSTPVDVTVAVANSASTTYSLAAALGTADTINTWDINATPITHASGPVAAEVVFGKVAYTIGLTIPFTGNLSTSISNTILFVATAD
jgi:hypothetical protein